MFINVTGSIRIVIAVLICNLLASYAHVLKWRQCPGVARDPLQAKFQNPKSILEIARPKAKGQNLFLKNLGQNPKGLKKV